MLCHGVRCAIGLPWGCAVGQRCAVDTPWCHRVPLCPSCALQSCMAMAAAPAWDQGTPRLGCVGTVRKVRGGTVLGWGWGSANGVEGTRMGVEGGPQMGSGVSKWGCSGVPRWVWGIPNGVGGSLMGLEIPRWIWDVPKWGQGSPNGGGGLPKWVWGIKWARGSPNGIGDPQMGLGCPQMRVEGGPQMGSGVP